MKDFKPFEFLEKNVVNSPFLKILDPFMNWLNNNKIYKQPFSIVYLILALAFSIAIPFYFIYTVISMSDFLKVKDIFLGINIFFILLAAGIVALRYWTERSCDVIKLTKDTDEYVATLVIAHLIKSIGEFGGIYLAIVGTLIIILAGTFDSRIASLVLSESNLVILLVTSLSIILSTRITAEMLSAICAIANNTKISEPNCTEIKTNETETTENE